MSNKSTYQPFQYKVMRERTTPHPTRVSVYVLNEALKKLLKVAAAENPDEYNHVKVLYRGMKDMTLGCVTFGFAEYASYCISGLM